MLAIQGGQCTYVNMLANMLDVESLSPTAFPKCSVSTQEPSHLWNLSPFCLPLTCWLPQARRLDSDLRRSTCYYRGDALGWGTYPASGGQDLPSKD